MQSNAGPARLGLCTAGSPSSHHPEQPEGSGQELRMCGPVRSLVAGSSERHLSSEARARNDTGEAGPGHSSSASGIGPSAGIFPPASPTPTDAAE
jgi:hypothetical protein